VFGNKLSSIFEFAIRAKAAGEANHPKYKNQLPIKLNAQLACSVR
jgi:hypothetical protein